jgi:hypothetical protein
MILRCTISYTTPDGALFEAGQLYTVEPEEGLWLMTVAEGQFALEDDALEGPPVDQAVGRPPLGGTPRGRTRAASDPAAGETGGLSPAGRRR